MTVATESLQRPMDLRVLDASSLSTHLWILRGRLAISGASFARSDIGARCVAKVLLQIIPRLVTVRAAQR